MWQPDTATTTGHLRPSGCPGHLTYFMFSESWFRDTSMVRHHSSMYRRVVANSKSSTVLKLKCMKCWELLSNCLWRDYTPVVISRGTAALNRDTSGCLCKIKAERGMFLASSSYPTSHYSPGCEHSGLS